MKKTIAIIGILLCLAGGGLLIGGFALNDWKPYNVTYEEKNFTSDTTALKKVEAELLLFSITVKPGDKLALKYYENDYSTFTVEERDGVLKIEEHEIGNTRYRSIIRFWRENRPKLELTLPAGNASSPAAIAVKATSSNVELAGKYTDASIDVTSGNVRMTGTDIQNLTVKLTSGNITIDRSNVENVTAQFTSGNASIADSTVGAFDGKGKSGNVSVTRSTMKTFGTSLTSGNLKLFDFKADKIDFVASSGEVKLDGVDAIVANYRMTSGNLKGTIAGAKKDYTVKLHSDSGKVSPGNSVSDTGRSITANVRSGNITVTFKEDY